MFQKIFTELLEKNGVTAYKVAKDIEISQGLIGDYKNGVKTPGAENLSKIADYFNVTIDELLGREKPNRTLRSGDGSINNPIVYNGNLVGYSNNSADIEEKAEKRNASVEEAALFNIFNGLDFERRLRILNFAVELRTEMTNHLAKRETYMSQI